MLDTILFFLLSINLVTFALYGIDKAKAKLDAWRIPEKTLLTLSLLGGFGGYIGMRTFRHKTQKQYFKFICFAGMVLNITLLALPSLLSN